MSSAYFNVTENRNFMKKLILMIAVMFTAITATFAQETERTIVEGNEMSLGFNFGFNGLLSPKANGFEDFKSSIGYTLGLDFNKAINPFVGVGVETSICFPRKEGVYNDAQVHYLDGGIYGDLNLNNLIHGFKGHSDRVEALLVLGGGFERNFDFNVNSLYTKGGVRAKVNIVDGWSFNAESGVQYLFNDNVLKYTNKNGRFYANVGFTKTFGKFKKSRVCDIAEFERVNEEVNALRAVNHDLKSKNSTLENENSKLIDTNNELSKQKPTVVQNNIMPVIQFEIGKSNIQPSQRASLEQIATFIKGNKNVNVTILGHADANTGTDARNAEISRERARSVKDALVSMGVESERLITFGKGSTEQPFGENDANRVVIFTETK